MNTWECQSQRLSRRRLLLFQFCDVWTSGWLKGSYGTVIVIKDDINYVFLFQCHMFYLGWCFSPAPFFLLSPSYCSLQGDNSWVSLMLLVLHLWSSWNALLANVSADLGWPATECALQWSDPPSVASVYLKHNRNAADHHICFSSTSLLTLILFSVVFI